jgi:hypothetical protein
MTSRDVDDKEDILAPTRNLLVEDLSFIAHRLPAKRGEVDTALHEPKVICPNTRLSVHRSSRALSR